MVNNAKMKKFLAKITLRDAQRKDKAKSVTIKLREEVRELFGETKGPPKNLGAGHLTRDSEPNPLSQVTPEFPAY